MILIIILVAYIVKDCKNNNAKMCPQMVQVCYCRPPFVKLLQWGSQNICLVKICTLMILWLIGHVCICTDVIINGYGVLAK